MKTVTILIPTYNEEENIPLIYHKVQQIFETLPYKLEFLFIDNFSKDGSKRILEDISLKDKSVKCIFNAKNFGFTRSTFYGLTQGEGDCVILIFADMQDPPAIIPEFLKKWEEGYKIVCGIKNKSKESKIVYFIRKMYYKFIKSVSDIDHIEQFTGFGLYDKSFVKILKDLKDPVPYLRGIVAELGGNRTEIYYEQKKRLHGKSSFNFLKLYDVAMLGITSYSKVILRLATFIGFAMSIISFFVAIVTFIMKLINWNKFPIGMAAISIGVFFLGSIQLFFIGLLGEYILNMNTRIMNRPLVIEEKRVNFK